MTNIMIEALEALEQEHIAKRTTMVKVILENGDNAFTKTELETMDYNRLKKTLALIPEASYEFYPIQIQHEEIEKLQKQIKGLKTQVKNLKGNR